MAITYWNAPNNVGSYYAWSSSAHWTNGVPGASDIAVFDGRTQGSVAGAGSAGSPISFGLAEFHDSYGGNLGLPGNDFHPNGDIEFHGTGGASLDISSITAKRFFVFDNQGFGNIIFVRNIDGADTSDIRVLSGKASIDGESSTSPIAVYGGIVDVDSLNGVSNLDVRGGTVLLKTQVTDLGIASGLVQAVDGSNYGGGGVFTNLKMSGGTYQNFSAIGDVWNSATVDGGLCEFLDATVRTITDVVEGPNGEFRAHKNTTVTNHLRLYPPLLLP